MVLDSSSRVWDVKLGFRVLGFGFRVLGSGFWVQGPVSWVCDVIKVRKHQRLQPSTYGSLP